MSKPIYAAKSMYLRLLSPSWFSFIVSLLLAAIIVGGITCGATYTGSTIQQYMANWNADARLQVVGDPYHAADINDKIVAIVNVLFSLVFWSALAIAIYAVIFTVLWAAKGLAELRREMGYVHGNRRRLFRVALSQLGLRLLAVILLWLLARVTIGPLLNYCIRISNQIAHHLWVAANVGKLALVGLLFTLCFHGLVVCVRLLLLRPRVFGDNAL